jgi:hypothetical protein
MKIRVALNIKTSSEADTIVDLIVRPSETVASVKEKVAGSQLIPFPEQELSLDGVVLADESKLAACGIAEGSSVTLNINATEDALAQQLKELLQARDLSSDELGLLYCYKYGANINQALKLLGFDGKLQDFIGKQKSLSMENGTVTLVRTDTALKPFSVVDEIVHILKASTSGTMEIKELCNKFVQKFGVNLSSIVGSRPVEFLSKERTVFEVHGRGLVSLQGSRSATSTEAAVVTEPPGLGGDAPPGLGGDAIMDVEQPAPIDIQQFDDLHNRIHSQSFNSQVMKSINDLVAALADTSFLDIDHVVIGGSIGKGTAIPGDAAAEIVFFLCDLPTTGPRTWQLPLLRAIAGVLSEEFQTAHGIESLHVTEDCLKMTLQGWGPMAVELYLSPTFESYEKTIQVIGEQGTDTRKVYSSALAKERTNFVARQPSSVKATIRLMKWWRDQQEWYGRLSRPSDELLELVAIYSAVQTRPADKKEAIANLMSLLSRFEQMRVVWANFYEKDDVWTPLLSEKPLLMDPTNPFVNVADSQAFDASELMVLARTTHFFW